MKGNGVTIAQIDNPLGLTHLIGLADKYFKDTGQENVSGIAFMTQVNMEMVLGTSSRRVAAAFDNDTGFPIGFISYYVSMFPEPVMWIEAIAAHGNKGPVGSLLLQFVEEIAKGHNLKKVCMMTANSRIADALFRRHGYEVKKLYLEREMERPIAKRKKAVVKKKPKKEKKDGRKHSRSKHKHASNVSAKAEGNS